MARSGARRIDPARLAVLRAAAQFLHRPASAKDPADVARAICGAQAQDPSAGRLAFRARSPRVRAVDVDRARTEERSLLRTWVMRGTMHLIATEDAAWLLPLYERALLQCGAPALCATCSPEFGKFRIGTGACRFFAPGMVVAMPKRSPFQLGESQ